jgi:hypothetical protein
LKEVLKLHPVAYKMKGTNTSDIGFLAQELKLVLPEIVYGKEGEMTVSYGQITPVLAKAIQEQQTIINTQQQTINEQGKALDQLKAQCAGIELKLNQIINANKNK